MSALWDFLMEHPVTGLREEVIVSPRLAEHPFTITAVSAGEMAEYTGRCKTSPQPGAGFDGEKFNLLLILNHCVEPDFRNSDALAQAGCATPEELVNKTLKAGEIAYLARAIYRLSGYDQTMTELRDMVKNS